MTNNKYNFNEIVRLGSLGRQPAPELSHLEQLALHLVGQAVLF